MDGPRAELRLVGQAQCGLAPLAGVRAVLEHEHLAARRCNLAEEAGNEGVAQLDRLRLGLYHTEESPDDFMKNHQLKLDAHLVM